MSNEEAAVSSEDIIPTPSFLLDREVQEYRTQKAEEEDRLRQQEASLPPKHVIGAKERMAHEHMTGVPPPVSTPVPVPVPVSTAAVWEGNEELQSASMLTMPLSQPTSARLHTVGISSSSSSSVPLGFGEDLSLEALLQVKDGKESHSQHTHVQMHPVSSKNIIAFADVLKCELQDKQRMIDSLLEEVKEKTQAIQIVGQDIRHLREEKIAFEAQVKDLKKEVKRHEDVAKEAVQKARDDRIKLKSAEGRDPIMLQNLIKNLSKKIEELTSEKILLEGEISDKEKLIAEAKELAEKYTQLQDAHLKSNQYVASIKKEISRIDQYKTTIRTQEKVIAKLQSVMESKLKSKFSFMRDDNSTLINNGSLLPPANPFPILRSQSSKDSMKEKGEQGSDSNEDKLLLEKTQEENATLQDKLKLLEDQVIELQKQNRELEKNQKAPTPRPASAKSTVSNMDEDEQEQEDAVDEEGQHPANMTSLKAANLKIDKLIAENISKKFRIEALERQLESSSRVSAKEIARLRTKLFELEISLSLLTNDNAEEEEEEGDDDDEETEGDSNTTSQTASRPDTSDAKPSSEAKVESDALGNISARKEEEVKPEELKKPETPMKVIEEKKEEKVEEKKDEEKLEDPTPETKVEEVKMPEERPIKSPPFPLKAEGGVLTKQDSGFDLDRIKTPPEVDCPAPNSNANDEEKKADPTDGKETTANDTTNDKPIDNTPSTPKKDDKPKPPPPSTSKKEKKRVTLNLPDGIIERSITLYDYGEDKIQDHESSMDELAAGIAGEATVMFHHTREVSDTHGVNHIFRLHRIKVTNYPHQDIQHRFSVYCKAYVYFRFLETENLRVRNNHHRFHHLHKSVWNIDTPHVKTPGATVQWDHDESQSAIEKTFTISEDMLTKYIDPDDETDENGVKIKITFKKVSAKSQEDFTMGIGTTSLFYLPKKSSI